MTCNLVDDSLNAKHRLGSAEPPKCSIRYGIGPTQSCRCNDILQKIGIVNVQQRTVVDWQRQVCRIAAPRCHIDLEAANSAAGAKPDFVFKQKIMPFPGCQHVDIPVEPEFCRSPCLFSDDCRNTGPLRRLCLLASERATHASHFHRHRVQWFIESFSDQQLYFRWVLR